MDAERLVWSLQHGCMELGMYLLMTIRFWLLGASDVSAAGGMATLALAVVIGLALGAIRVRGVRLGISGVLFSSLLFGQLGWSVDPTVLSFLRDFALILFVYAIGLQVGPGFVTSLRSEGLKLNLLSVVVLVLGAAMSAMVGHWLPASSAAGLYTGAFTTTPGLAAAQDAIRHGHGMGGAAGIARTALAYTVTYPFGIIGPVLVVAALRWVFRVKLDEEKRALAAAAELRRPSLEAVDIEVTEAAHAGKPLRSHPLLKGNGVVFVRMLREGVLTVPSADTELRVGDVYRAVGPKPRIEALTSSLGRRSSVDLRSAAGDVQRMDLVVTHTQVLRRTLRELDLTGRHGVTVARVNRAGVNLAPKASLRLAFADRLTVVGPEAGLKIVEAELGNSPDVLNRPQLVPIFLGIVLGVIVGSIPLAIPGLHMTVRIGLAGGPMLAAIALSQLGNVGSVVWYMPVSANQLFRDFGLAVFLACVGLAAGDHFVQRAAEGGGMMLLAWGALVTVLPVFLIACVARIGLRMNFITLIGWVAGAMTSSPALLFSDELAGSDAPAVAYAAVAPLATLLPIICAQVLAISGA